MNTHRHTLAHVEWKRTPVVTLLCLLFNVTLAVSLLQTTKREFFFLTSSLSLSLVFDEL